MLDWISSLSVRPEIIDTTASIIGTAVALFFTLAVLPYQFYASQYSTALFFYLRRDNTLKLYFALLVACVMTAFALQASEIGGATLIAACALLLITFLIVFRLVMWSLKSLDPAAYLIPRVVEFHSENIRKAFKKAERSQRSDMARLAELNEAVEHAIRNADAVSPNLPFSVPREISVLALHGTRQLKQLSLRFLELHQHELFKAALRGTSAIAQSYIVGRQRYQETIDHFLIELSDDLKDIGTASRSGKNMHDRRALWAAIEAICLIPIRQNLVHGRRVVSVGSFTKVLRDNIYLDIAENRTDSAYEACRSLNNIGSAYGRSGEWGTVVEIAGALPFISQLAIARMSYPVMQIARIGLASITYSYARSPNPGIEIEHTLAQLADAFDAMLQQDKRSLGVMNNDVIEDTTVSDDVFGVDVTLKGICKQLIFCNNEQEHIREQMLGGVTRLTRLMKQYVGKSHSTRHHFSADMYCVGFYLIASLSPDPTRRLALIDYTINRSDRELGLIGRLLAGIARWFAREHVRYRNREIDFQHYPNAALGNSVSMLLLLIAVHRFHDDVDLADTIKEVASSIAAELIPSEEVTLTDREDLARIHDAYRIAEQSGLLADDDDRSHQLAARPVARIRGYTLIDRPLVTLDANYFSEIEAALRQN